MIDHGLKACFKPGVGTFGQLVDSILAAADQGVRPIGRLLKRRIIERLVNEVRASGRLEYFAAIADKPGFIDLVANLISDLQRQRVSPTEFTRLVESVGIAGKNRELAAIYAGYQSALDDHQLYDAESRFLLATELVKNGCLGQLNDLRLMVVDGFTDFTSTQHGLLQAIAAEAGSLEEVIVTLPLENGSQRDELFLKPRETLAELGKRHHGLKVEWVRRTPPQLSLFPDEQGQQAQPQGTSTRVFRVLEERIFCNPRDVASGDRNAIAAGDKVEILAASGQLDEIQSVARRIKRLLVLGDDNLGGQRVLPEQIAVVFRSLETCAGAGARGIW